MKLQYDSQAISLLRTSGRIMLVFGALSLVIYLPGLLGILFLQKTTANVFAGEQDLIGMGLFFLGAVIELIAGLFGVRVARRPGLAGKSLLVFGSLTAVLAVAETGFLAMRSGFSKPPLLGLSLILGLAAPAVYLFAAAKLQKGPHAHATANEFESTEA